LKNLRHASRHFRFVGFADDPSPKENARRTLLLKITLSTHRQGVQQVFFLPLSSLVDLLFEICRLLAIDRQGSARSVQRTDKQGRFPLLPAPARLAPNLSLTSRSGALSSPDFRRRIASLLKFWQKFEQALE
jgi:hypothetical protein